MRTREETCLVISSSHYASVNDALVTGELADMSGYPGYQRGADRQTVQMTTAFVSGRSALGCREENHHVQVLQDDGNAVLRENSLTRVLLLPVSFSSQ